MRKINVAIAEDQELVREGIALILEDAAGIRVVQCASNGTELLYQLIHYDLKPDVVLMDVEMPGMNGFEATAKVLDVLPMCKILFLSSHCSPTFIEQAIQSKGHGYLSKDSEVELLVKAIETVTKKGYYFNELFSRQQLKRSLHATRKPKAREADGILSEKEKVYVRLLCEEKTDVEIASILNISVHTANSYRKKIQKKIDARRTIGIVLYAVKEGLV